MAIHLDEIGAKRVSVVSCKSWQSGFDIDLFYENLSGEGIRGLEGRNKKIGTGEVWKKFRELVETEWAKAFRDKIFYETKSHDFTYFIAVTKITKDKKREQFKQCKAFIDNLSEFGKYNVKIDFITLEDMLLDISNQKSETTLEATEIGRFMQLIKAADLKFISKKNPNLLK